MEVSQSAYTSHFKKRSHYSSGIKWFGQNNIRTHCRSALLNSMFTPLYLHLRLLFSTISASFQICIKAFLGTLRSGNINLGVIMGEEVGSTHLWCHFIFFEKQNDTLKSTFKKKLLYFSVGIFFLSTHFNSMLLYSESTWTLKKSETIFKRVKNWK